MFSWDKGITFSNTFCVVFQKMWFEGKIWKKHKYERKTLHWYPVSKNFLWLVIRSKKWQWNADRISHSCCWSKVLKWHYVVEKTCKKYVEGKITWLICDLDEVLREIWVKRFSIFCKSCFNTLVLFNICEDFIRISCVPRQSY